MKPQLAIRYFKAWAEKDIGTLDILMADNIILTDWEGQALGKEAVLKFNQIVFEKCKSIAVDIEKVAVGQDCVFAELGITINGSTKIQVVDVLDYDQDDKIKRIRAYKR
jgi:hypothetical protein